MKQATNFMGNINYFGKSFKGTLWGRDKDNSEKNKAMKDEKNKKN